MSGFAAMWQVALREITERAKSKAVRRFVASRLPSKAIRPGRG